jgi:type IV secretory pathway component VirB8
VESEKQIAGDNKNRSHRQLLQEERYIWMARAFVMMTVLGVLANILLLVAISGAVPFLRVQPFFLDVRSRDEQLVSVERLSAQQLNDRNLQDYLVRQYITSYFNVGLDPEEYERRTGLDSFLALQSEGSAERKLGEMRSETLRLMKQQNFTREAVIRRTERVAPLQNGDWEWRALVDLMDTNQGATEPSKQTIELKLRIGFNPGKQTSSWSQRLKNPLGFKVKDIGSEVVNIND